MKLSIIIPTLGRPSLRHVLHGISECEHFESIHPEILAVFDVSEAPESLKKEFPYVTFITTPKKGVSAARNAGLDVAKGDIVVFLGDDTVPTSSWLIRTISFHQRVHDETVGLLGKTSWHPRLSRDPFHAWLENNAQFEFEQIRHTGAKWLHFYTSNISLKRSLIGQKRFLENFTGWGFEDIEFGYRLKKDRGLRLFFDEECEVWHDHPQTLEGLCQNFCNARKNAQIFEAIHPEIVLLPRGSKKVILELGVWLAGFFPKKLFPETYWWRKWKGAWLGKGCLVPKKED